MSFNTPPIPPASRNDVLDLSDPDAPARIREAISHPITNFFSPVPTEHLGEHANPLEPTAPAWFPPHPLPSSTSTPSQPSH